MQITVLNKNNLTANKACRFYLLIAAVIFSVKFSMAQTQVDTAATMLTAAADKKTAPIFIAEQSNIIFPAILKGTEKESLEYIEKFSSHRREYLMRMYNKGKKLLPQAAAILNKYNIPEELKVLMTLESAYNANAVSRAGAVGYWQFMDNVAREYGLRYATRLTAAERKRIKREHGRKAAAFLRAAARQKDDRKNFNKSTIAAARYLRDRRANLDDNWLLIVASYNCGVGNVWSAMERTGKSNPTFWDIKKYLPAETRSYVMNFITLNVIFHNYENFAKNKLVFAAVKNAVPDNIEEDNKTTTDASAASLKLK